MPGGTVRMQKFLHMLNACAPGFEMEEKEHRHWVRFKGKTFRAVPLGPHGARRNVEVKLSVVRQLVAYFELDPACVESDLPMAKGLLRKPAANSGTS